MTGPVLDVRRGVPFTVEVPSVPTTGYRWRIADLPDGVELRDSTFRPDPGAQVGDGGVQVFLLVAVTAGEHRIGLACARPWEAEPVEVRSIRVRVAEAGG